MGSLEIVDGGEPGPLGRTAEQGAEIWRIVDADGREVAAFDSDLMIRGHAVTLVGRRGLGRADWLRLLRFANAREGGGIWADALAKHTPDVAAVFERALRKGIADTPIAGESWEIEALASASYMVRSALGVLRMEKNGEFVSRWPGAPETGATFEWVQDWAAATLFEDRAAARMAVSVWASSNSRTWV